MADPNAGPGEPVDVVYTWVDDRFPGYAEQLRTYAGGGRDIDPNRTRDNLELLRFSLRSVAKFAPFVRRIHLVTCRPQVPAWLNTDHPNLRVVHHDRFIPAQRLPTFNSFCIVSHLHLVPDVTERFLYLEDDILLGAPFSPALMTAPDGRPLSFFQRGAPKDPNPDPTKEKAWTIARATANAALDREFGPGLRNFTIHGPVLFDRALFAAMVERFPVEFERTRASRFRGGDNIAPEYFYWHYLAASGQGVAASRAQVRQMEGFASLENFLPWTWLQLRMLEWRKPRSLTLNDSFNDRPNPRVERLVRRTLERWFPEPSPYELPGM